MNARAMQFPAGIILLAVCALSVPLGEAEAAQHVQPSAALAGDWVVSHEASKNNWHTRELLDQQLKAKEKSQPIGGVEQEIILENYRKSIGKGGAGAPLFHRSPQGQ